MKEDLSPPPDTLLGEVNCQGSASEKIASPSIEPVESARFDVGARLRVLRAESGLSLRGLAERSGLNFNTLRLIESGKTSPGVGTLSQLADALSVPISDFFLGEDRHRDIVLQKAGQRPSEAVAGGVFENLAEGYARTRERQCLIRLRPGSAYPAEPAVHAGSELVFCLSGTLEYEINGTAFRLEPEDSLLFDAAIPHRWRNPGMEESRSLLILLPPEPPRSASSLHFSADAENADRDWCGQARSSPPGAGCGERRGRGRGNQAGSGPAGHCVCPRCGRRTVHRAGQRCADHLCPDCGTRMIRA